MFIQTSASLTTGTVNDNVIAGNQFEFAPVRSIVEIGILGSATGLEADILIGQRTVITRMLPSIVTVTNRFPIYPDDYTIKSGAQQGERLIIRVRNPTGGTITAFVAVRFNPR